MGSIRAILETKWQSRSIFEAAASRGSKRVMVLTEVLIHKLIVNLMGSKWVECKFFPKRSITYRERAI